MKQQLQPTNTDKEPEYHSNNTIQTSFQFLSINHIHEYIHVLQKHTFRRDFDMIYIYRNAKWHCSLHPLKCSNTFKVNIKSKTRLTKQCHAITFFPQLINHKFFFYTNDQNDNDKGTDWLPSSSCSVSLLSSSASVLLGMSHSITSTSANPTPLPGTARLFRKRSHFRFEKYFPCSACTNHLQECKDKRTQHCNGSALRETIQITNQTNNDENTIIHEYSSVPRLSQRTINRSVGRGWKIGIGQMSWLQNNCSIRRPTCQKQQTGDRPGITTIH